jgi:hypothetical protein
LTEDWASVSSVRAPHDPKSYRVHSQRLGNEPQYGLDSKVDWTDLLAVVHDFSLLIR